MQWTERVDFISKVKSYITILIPLEIKETHVEMFVTLLFCSVFRD